MAQNFPPRMDANDSIEHYLTQRGQMATLYNTHQHSNQPPQSQQQHPFFFGNQMPALYQDDAPSSSAQTATFPSAGTDSLSYGTGRTMISSSELMGRLGPSQFQQSASQSLALDSPSAAGGDDADAESLADLPTQPDAMSNSTTHSQTSNAKKKKKLNPWGDKSYADLIEKSILASPMKKLHLSEIYEYFKRHHPYFKTTPCANSSQGWKNSIRHNLSLRRKFVRMPDAQSKKSWWTLDYLLPQGHRSKERSSSIWKSSGSSEYLPPHQFYNGPEDLQFPTSYAAAQGLELMKAQYDLQTEEGGVGAQVDRNNKLKRIETLSLKQQEDANFYEMMKNVQETRQSYDYYGHRPGSGDQQNSVQQGFTLLPKHFDGSCISCNDLMIKMKLYAQHK